MFCLSPFATATERIRIIVPVTAGGSYDIVARLISKYLNVNGYSTTVENIVGAGGLIAYQRSINEKTKVILVTGDTLFLSIVSDQISKKDFTLISFLADMPLFFLVSTASGINCENIMLRRITMGTAGKGSTSDIATRLLRYNDIPKIAIIPYKGQVDAIRDIMAGVIDGALGSLAQIHSDRLVAIFNTSDAAIKGVPSMTTCFGSRNYLKSNYLMFTNKEWNNSELIALNQLMNNFIASTEFQISAKKLDLNIRSGANLSELNSLFYDNIKKYERISQIMHLD